MTNRDTMHAALKKTVFPYLRSQGFVGAYPHFRREKGACIELLTFQTNKWGGSFWVEVSVVFPGREKSNIAAWDAATQPLSTWCTHARYRLPGMFGGEFYYCDVYDARKKWARLLARPSYMGVFRREDALVYQKSGCKCVQYFNRETAEAICGEIIRQMDKAYRWMQKFEAKNR